MLYKTFYLGFGLKPIISYKTHIIFETKKTNEMSKCKAINETMNTSRKEKNATKKTDLIYN